MRKLRLYAMKRPAQDHTANSHSLEFRSRPSKPRVHVLNHRSAGLLTSCDVMVLGARIPSRPCPAACFPMPSLRAFGATSPTSGGSVGEREEEREPGPPMPWNSRRAGTRRSLGPDALHIHLAPAGRWGRWSVLPACQLAQDAWVAGTSATWMGVQPASHRHAAGSEEQMGWPAGPLALR